MHTCLHFKMEGGRDVVEVRIATRTLIRKVDKNKDASGNAYFVDKAYYIGNIEIAIKDKTNIFAIPNTTILNLFVHFSLPIQNLATCTVVSIIFIYAFILFRCTGIKSLV